jgi:CRISPR/Cas system CMR-associated protein Cmr5 small subunit
MADEMDVADLDISKETLKTALGTIDSIKTQRIQAMDALSSLAQADIARAEANAKAEYDADVQNNTYRKQEYDAARQAAMDTLAREDATTEQLLSVADQMRQVYDADLERRLDMLNMDPEYMEADAEMRDELEANAYADAAAYARMSNYQNIVKALEQRLNTRLGFNFGR